MFSVSSPGLTEQRLLKQKEAGTQVAALIDPESFTPQAASELAKTVHKLGVSCIFIGGSTIADQGLLDEVVTVIKRDVTLTILLFPGNITGI